MTVIRKVAVTACAILALFTATPTGAWAAPADPEPGTGSSQMTLIQGTLNKPCIAIGKLGLQSVIGLINIGVQDVPILTSQQQQQCTDNSTINGDDALSHILDEIPILSGNGSANG
ncbi:rodlin [Streptomyces noursei]|uniref:rodlin n=1 Tax=Streptomyces noursei TaxID=1971 RepID=UPI00380E1FAD